MSTPTHRFVYLAKTMTVVDGDTVEFYIDQGLHRYTSVRVRLCNINTPERGQPLFKEAKKFTRDWLANADEAWKVYLKDNPDLLKRNDIFSEYPILITTYKGDAFGRWLAFVHDRFDNCLNTALVSAKLAKPFMVELD